MVHKEVEEMQNKASMMKRELERLNHELNSMNEAKINGKRMMMSHEKEIENIKKQEETLLERMKFLEVDVRKIQATDITLSREIGLGEGKHLCKF